MNPDVELTSKASADLRRLDPSVARRVIDKLQWLADNFRVLRHEPLRGDWERVFKLRVGAYRVLYSIESNQESSRSLRQASKRDVQEAMRRPSTLWQSMRPPE